MQDGGPQGSLGERSVQVTPGGHGQDPDYPGMA